jgi:hypothetical protein
MPKLSLTERLSAALEKARASLSRADADEIEDMVVEVAMLELGPERAQTWAAGKRADDHGQNVLPFPNALHSCPCGSCTTPCPGSDGKPLCGD